MVGFVSSIFDTNYNVFFPLGLINKEIKASPNSPPDVDSTDAMGIDEG